jgi:Bacterial Ig-like domain/FG-GAP-like repeat
LASRAITHHHDMPRTTLCTTALWRWSLVTIGSLVLAACGGGGGGGESPPQALGPVIPGQFMPLQAGDRWVYRSFGIDPIIVQVLEPASAGGVAGMRVRTTSHIPGALLPPATITESVLADQADAVVEVVTLSTDALAPALGAVPLLRKPLREGDRFEQVNTTVRAAIDLDGDGRAEDIAVQSVVTVVGLADQTVPAGSFAGCLHLRTELRQSARLSASGQRVESVGTSDVWFAPDLGPVRIDTLVRSGSATTSQSSRVLTAYRVGGRSNDVDAPRVVRTTPTEGVMHPSQFGLAVEFNEAMDPGLMATEVSVLDSLGAPVPGTVTVGERQVSFQPRGPLGTGDYTLRVAGSMADLAGLPLGSEHRVRFQVDATRPQVASMSPAPGSTGAPIDGPIVLRMSEPLSTATQLNSQVALIDAETGADISAELALAGDTLTLRPLQPLRRDRAYQVRLCCLVDAQGNAIEPTTTPAFRTAPGRFGTMTPWLTDGLDSAAGDLNGDGRADLAGVAWVPGSDRGALGLYLRLQQPDGTLGPVIDTGWRHADRLCAGARPMIGDIDRDGRPDLALAVGTCRVEFLRQGTDGRFTGSAGAPPIDVNDGHGAPQMLDLEGDGRLDLVRPRGPGVVQRWRANAQGGFDPAPDALTGLAETGLVLQPASFMDLNGDGRLDLLLPLRHLSSEEIVVALQAADGHFTPVQRLAGVDAALDAGDLDHDGRVDLVLRGGLLATGPQWLQLWRQDPSGTWAMAMTLPDSVLASARIADIDGDGLQDLTIHRYASSLSWRRQGPDAQLAAEEPYEVVPADGSLQLVDLTGDGLLDVVVGGHRMPQRATTGAAAAAAGLQQRVLQQLRRQARALSAR